MNKRVLIAAGSLAALVLIGVIAWLVSRPSKDSCEYYQYTEAQDRFFEPYLAEPTEVKWFVNYAKCNKPQKGDIVWYELGNPKQNFYRILVAVEGDEVQQVPDNEGRGWNLIVNGKMLMANDVPYFFGVPGKQTTLSIYLQNNMKTLGSKEIIMFSTNPPGFNDSGIFGLYNIDSMKGRVELPKEKQKVYSEYVARMYSEEVAKSYFERPPADFNKKPEVPKPVGLAPTNATAKSSEAGSESDEDLIFNDKEEKSAPKIAKPITIKKPQTAKKASTTAKSQAKGKTTTKSSTLKPTNKAKNKK